MTIARRQPESDIVAEVLVTLGARADLCVVWRQRSGTFWTRETPPSQPLQAVPEGAADVSGLLAGSGRRIEVECKTPVGRLSGAQIRWRAMIERMGGLYLVARSGPEALAGVLNALGRQGVAPGVQSMSRALPAERSRA